jgi:hypothetical protein
MLRYYDRIGLPGPKRCSAEDRLRGSESAAPPARIAATPALSYLPERDSPISLRVRRSIFPEPVFGIASRNSMRRGTL